MSLSLQFRGLTKRYIASGRPAVEGVDLSLSEGEILALVGESGCGKTTLLRLAAGLEAPDEGEIRLGDEVVARSGVWVPPEQRGIGLVFQDGALFPHLTVEANLTYGMCKKNAEELRAATETLLGMVGLKDMKRRFPHELSGGERQRLAVARALAPQPRVVLLDEPFSNLDSALRRTLREEIRALLVELEATVILVTHSPDDALAVGDRIAVLRDGHIEQTGTPEDVYRNPRSAYCAKLFGPANLVEQNGKESRWLRPEQMRLVTQREAGAVEACVVRKHDAGRHLEVYVLPKDRKISTEREEWLVFLNSGESIQEGATVWITI